MIYMTFEEWINKVIQSGNLCSGYTGKVSSANSKLQLVRIVLDANGVSYLPEMDAKGFPLPYDTILKEFKNYINGNYTAMFSNDKGHGYSSSLYCCYAGGNEINVDSTLSVYLGCSNVTLKIRENDFVYLYIDKNCDLSIECPESSKCLIDYWEGANIDTSKSKGNIILTKR